MSGEEFAKVPWKCIHGTRHEYQEAVDKGKKDATRRMKR